MSTQKGISTCPRCNRTVATSNSMYVQHNIAAEEICPLSKRRVPYQSHQQSAADYVGRAHIVANLAAMVQDEDPAVAWDYLTALPADELQRVAMLALAGIRIDQTVGEMYAWVADLPVADLADEPDTISEQKATA